MAKKKVNKIEKKLVVEEGDAYIPEAVIEKESRTLIWVLVGIGCVFALVLVPHFWSVGVSSFDYGNISWEVEEYAEPTGTIYHGRFLSFEDDELYYNVYLTVDPRENAVEVVGDVGEVSDEGVYIVLTEESDACTSGLSLALGDLTAFLRTGVGVDAVSAAAINVDFANESGLEYVACDETDWSVVAVEFSSEAGVVVDGEGCYTIYVTGCDDLSGVEKFMVELVGNRD